MSSTEIGLIILIGGCLVAIAWCGLVKYWDDKEKNRGG